jgi:hypothetical protein
LSDVPTANLRTLTKVRPRWYVPAPACLAANWLRGIDYADLALA